MVSYISNWAREVILAVIVSIILEMILPSKAKNTKYIKTVIGIYVMYVMIAPALKLINGGTIDFSNSNYEKYFNEEIYSTLENNIKDVEQDNLKETYELGVKQDIEEKLRQKGYIVSNINLDINLKENSEEYGTIKKIEIQLSKKNEKESEIQVNKIKIGEDKISDTEKNEIINFVSQEYGINFEKIDIN